MKPAGGDTVRKEIGLKMALDGETAKKVAAAVKDAKLKAISLAATEEKVHLGVFYEEERPVYDRSAREFEPQRQEFILEDYLKRFS